MAAMLVFTIIMNLAGWIVFALTDFALGSFSGVHLVMLAEWFVMPMAASAIYRAVTGAGHFSDAKEKTMYMLMWFVLGAGMSGIVCKLVESGRWFTDGAFNRFDYLSYAGALVLGFIIYSAAYEVVRFFVDGGFAARRPARAK